jgi:hypothetical protein
MVPTKASSRKIHRFSPVYRRSVSLRSCFIYCNWCNEQLLKCVLVHFDYLKVSRINLMLWRWFTLLQRIDGNTEAFYPIKDHFGARAIAVGSLCSNRVHWTLAVYRMTYCDIVTLSSILCFKVMNYIATFLFFPGCPSQFI